MCEVIRRLRVLKILILEDNAERIKYFTENLSKVCELEIVKTSKEAISKLKDSFWDIAFLDHDLGDQVFQKSGEDTGYEVAEFLAANKDRMPGRVIIHSWNAEGAANMKSLLPDATCAPFGTFSL